MSQQTKQPDSWVTNFINELEDAKLNGGQVELKDGLIISLGTDLINLIIQNRFQLERVGEEAFRNFLAMLSAGNNFDALVAVYSKLDTAALVQNFKTDTVKLAEIALQAQQARDFWVELAKQAGMKLVSTALSTLLA